MPRAEPGDRGDLVRAFGPTKIGPDASRHAVPPHQFLAYGMPAAMLL